MVSVFTDAWRFAFQVEDDWKYAAMVVDRGVPVGVYNASVCLELQGCFSSRSWGTQGIHKDGFSFHLQKCTDTVFIPPSPGNGKKTSHQVPI